MDTDVVDHKPARQLGIHPPGGIQPPPSRPSGLTGHRGILAVSEPGTRVKVTGAKPAPGPD
jgi:hypothetical protein